MLYLVALRMLLLVSDLARRRACYSLFEVLPVDRHNPLCAVDVLSLFSTQNRSSLSACNWQLETGGLDGFSSTHLVELPGIICLKDPSDFTPFSVHLLLQDRTSSVSEHYLPPSGCMFVFVCLFVVAVSRCLCLRSAIRHMFRTAGRR